MSAPIIYDLTACEMNAAELREWDAFHAHMTDHARAGLMLHGEAVYQVFHKRWLYLLRKRQSDQDREALGMKPLTLEQAPPPLRS